MHLKIHNDVSYINSYGGKSDSIVCANLLTLKKTKTFFLKRVTLTCPLNKDSELFNQCSSEICICQL